MGARGDSGASGSDAGFENTTKSKLTKKNQKLVDTDFDERGKVKIDQAVKTPSLAVLSGPLKAGSKVTRNFFTDKVLGSKNYRGTSKKDFENLTVSQQESMYESYLEGRQSGKTDAYGNPLSGGGGGDNNQMSSTGTTTKTALLSSTPTSTEADEVITETASEKPKTEDERIIAAKRKNKTRTRLTQKDDELTLGKKVLLSS